jgi:predicted alpha/beta-hydrolase family hydrolase
MAPASRPATISWEGGEPLEAAIDSPDASPLWAMVLAHGAGTDFDTPRLAELGLALAARGVCVVRFRFPYRQAGRRAPDRMPRLEAAYRAAAGFARSLAPSLALGGHSMGGRVASHLAASGEPCGALVLASYPLFPAGGGPARDGHLPSVEARTLFVQGTRDPLCPLAELRRVIPLMTAASLVEVEGGDHSLELPRALRGGEAMSARVAQAICTFLCDGK